MATNYSPVATLHPQLTLPSPGDAATAASVNNAGLKYLADNIEFLRAFTSPLSAGGTFTPSGTLRFAGTAGVSVPSGTLSVGGAVQSVGGVSTVDGSFAGNVTVSGTLGVTGATTLGGTVSGSGRNRLGFSAATRTDVDQTIPRNTLSYGAPLPSGACTWTVDPSGEAAGDWVWCHLGTITTNVLINTSSGGIVTLSTGGTHWVFAVLFPVVGWKVVASGS